MAQDPTLKALEEDLSRLERPLRPGQRTSDAAFEKWKRDKANAKEAISKHKEDMARKMRSARAPGTTAGKGEARRESAKILQKQERARMDKAVKREMGSGRKHLLDELELERSYTGKLSPKKAKQLTKLRSAFQKAVAKHGPKALGIGAGVAGKLLLTGAAKAVPLLTEVSEIAGRKDPSLKKFFRKTEEGVTKTLGLPQRSQMPVHSMSKAREGAANVMLRTGRKNLRPGFDKPAITKQELEYVKKKKADKGRR